MKIEYMPINKVIGIHNGSITKYDGDAIVIPANPDLDYTGMGAQNIVARDGGSEIFREALEVADKYAKRYGYSDINGLQGKVPLFSAHMTNAGRLAVKKVVHSVAFDYDEEKGLYCDKDIISESTRNVLELGKKNKLNSIGFTPLGTLHGVTLEDSVETMTKEFENHLIGDTSLQQLDIVLFGKYPYLKACSHLKEIM